MKQLGNLFPVSAVMGREFIAKCQCCRRRLLWPGTFSAEFTMCQDVQLCEKRAGVIQYDHMIFSPGMFFIYTYTHTLEEAKGLWSRCKIWAIAFQPEDHMLCESLCTELMRWLLYWDRWGKSKLLLSIFNKGGRLTLLLCVHMPETWPCTLDPFETGFD